MISNRQNSRRRGRGGSSQGRPSGGGSGQRDSGNRIDSRSRGNAAQLLEKYKNMAREAQMSGDRVQTEYFLQFADHYFRVLADSRARSDDHRPIRPVDDFDGSDEEYGDEGEPIRAGEQGDHRPQQGGYQPVSRESQQPRRDDDGRRDEGRREDVRRDDGRRDDGRREQQARDDRPRRDYQPREERAAQATEAPMREANGYGAREEGPGDRGERTAGDEPRAPLTRRPRTPRPAPRETGEAMEADRLPPAFGIQSPTEERADTGESTAESESKPRRRRRPSTPSADDAQTG